MAWLWWLLAPVLSTVAGSLLLWWRSSREAGAATLRPRRAIRDHRAVLSALAGPQGESEVPATMVVLVPAPAERIPASAR